MKALGILWAIHVSSIVMFLVIASYTDGEAASGPVAYLLLVHIVFGLAYVIQLGREAVKRKRRWIVWCLLGFLVPFWHFMSFPIFYNVTRNDELKEAQPA